MPGEESKADESNVEHIFQPPLAILELARKSVLVVPWAVGDDGGNVSDCVIPPDLKPLLEFFAGDGNVIVDWEEDLRFTLLGYFVSPVHGVVGSLVEVDWSFPLVLILEDTELLHWLLVVPDDAHLGENGTVHFSVFIEELHELGVVASAGVGDCDEAKTNSDVSYVVGTSSLQKETARRVNAKMTFKKIPSFWWLLVILLKY